MTSIFTELGAGFAHGSPTNLGAGGMLGSAALGRAGEGVSLNAETGNLVVSQLVQVGGGQRLCRRCDAGRWADHQRAARRDALIQHRLHLPALRSRQDHRGRAVLPASTPPKTATR
jgi:hypothetical protein